MVNSAETGLFAIAAAMSGFVRYRKTTLAGNVAQTVFDACAPWALRLFQIYGPERLPGGIRPSTDEIKARRC